MENMCIKGVRKVKKKVFRERYQEVEMIDNPIEEEIKTIVEEAMKEEKPKKRGRKKSVKSDK